MRLGTYKLLGVWPQGARSEHNSPSLDDLRTLADNWSRAGADCVIVSATNDVVERYSPRSPSPGER